MPGHDAVQLRTVTAELTKMAKMKAIIGMA